MESRLSLVLRNDLCELQRMSEAVSAWCRGNGISAATEFHVNLALDEIVSNVIRYGWKDDREHYVGVRACHSGNALDVEVEDDGAPFNPLEVPSPNLNCPPAERPVGGLGIHLVRQVMDRLEYQRLNDKNLLVMKKIIDRA
ncbi:MAG: ATP-binding protein [Acidobacteria bacterium]|nr:MAG: ATP-binding protein [Acidobacteriota bacterium]